MELKLEIFEGISLEKMSDIRLMKRMDKKYVLSSSLLPLLLEKLHQDYYVQDISGRRSFEYATLYFDTPRYEMYHIHQNGKLNRMKIRTREYLNTDLCFLEIKTKSNKGITKKIRIPNPRLDCIHEKEAPSFIDMHTPYDILKIEPKLHTFYDRITLVNKAKTERLTIDYNLHFSNTCTREKVSLPEMVIMEIKKEQSSYSPVQYYLNQLRIRPRGMSKYCLGTALTDSQVKTNLFKRKIRYLNKITNIIYE